jgi:hypothetical protein
MHVLVARRSLLTALASKTDVASFPILPYKIDRGSFSVWLLFKRLVNLGDANK